MPLVLHPGPHFGQGGATSGLEAHQGRVIRRPGRQAALPQIILIVQPQFLQAGARHVGEFEPGFFGRATGLGLPSAMFCTPERAACTI